MPHDQFQEPPLADFEEVFARFGEFGFRIADALIVHVNGAGFDQTLGFGVGRREIHCSEQFRQTHWAGDDGEFLGFDVFRDFASSETRD